MWILDAPPNYNFIFRIISKITLFILTFSQVSELQAPPQHATIDLSLNRTQPAPTTTTTTSLDNNAAANTEHTDPDTLPAEEGIANEDPKPRSAGSAKSTRSSHTSQVVDDLNSSKPEDAQEGEIQQGSGEKEGGEENTEPESTVKDEGVTDNGDERASGEATNPPVEEVVEEEEVTETKEEERPPSHQAEEASELEATNDTAIEEVPEEQPEQEEAGPHTAAAADDDGGGGGGEPEEVEPQPNEEGSHEEQQGAVDTTTEPLDTSVPEEIVVRVRFHAVALSYIIQILL